MKGILTLTVLAALVAMPLTATAQLAVPLNSADGFANSANHGYGVQASSPAVTVLGTRDGSTLQLGPGDDGEVDVPVGFSFNFFGTSYSAVQVNGNGHIYFGTGYNPSSNYINGGNGNSAHPEDNGGSIHTNYSGPRADFWWDDLDSGAGGEIRTLTRGTAGSQEFVVQFENVPPFSNDLLTTVQLILHEGSDELTMNYIDSNGSGTARNGLAIGIQGSDTEYLQYGWFPGDAVPLSGNGIPASGESLRWGVGIPEPTSLVLFAISGLGLIASRKRRLS